MIQETLTQRQCRFTHALSFLINQAHAQGFEIKIVELNRLPETQKAYVAKGVSRTLNSRHLDNLAVDIILYKDGVQVNYGRQYEPLGIYWEGLGGTWGGRWGETATEIGFDPGHYEFTRP